MKIQSWHVIAVFILLVPALEMYFLLHTGNVFGPIPTVIMVIASAATGAYFLKQQGILAWQRLRECMARGDMPTREIIDGAFVMAGGLFLLSPGVFTDIVGLTFILPFTRDRYIQLLIGQGWLTLPVPEGEQTERIIDGSFDREGEHSP